MERQCLQTTNRLTHRVLGDPQKRAPAPLQHKPAFDNKDISQTTIQLRQDEIEHLQCDLMTPLRPMLKPVAIPIQTHELGITAQQSLDQIYSR